MKEGDCGLFNVLSRNLPGWTKENQKVEMGISEPKTETETSRVWSRTTNHTQCVTGSSIWIIRLLTMQLPVTFSVLGAYTLPGTFSVILSDRSSFTPKKEYSRLVSKIQNINTRDTTLQFYLLLCTVWNLVSRRDGRTYSALHIFMNAALTC